MASAAPSHSGANESNNDPSRIPCTKIFIQRDFSDGTSCRFANKFPPELEGKVDHGTYENTLNNLNQLYAEAERIECKTLCEGRNSDVFERGRGCENRISENRGRF